MAEAQQSAQNRRLIVYIARRYASTNGLVRDLPSARSHRAPPLRWCGRQSIALSTFPHPTVRTCDAASTPQVGRWRGDDDPEPIHPKWDRPQDPACRTIAGGRRLMAHQPKTGLPLYHTDRHGEQRFSGASEERKHDTPRLQRATSCLMSRRPTLEPLVRQPPPGKRWYRSRTIETRR